ncbi:MAG: hypothetical protein ABIO57_00060 [Candidatus Paceibacterota bacterium]
MKTLKIIHNAGFFSCCSKRLEGAVWFYNKKHTIPGAVDSSAQFSLYKSDQSVDLTPLYFEDNSLPISYTGHINFYNEMQFFDYSDLDHKGLQLFVKKYFSPSDYVISIVDAYQKKYTIDYDNTCGVFYRGNDKSTETGIAPYQEFIMQAKKIKEQNLNIVFLVQSDETEFIEAFGKELPGFVMIEEIPHMHKKSSTIHDELSRKDRAGFGADFFAALLIQAKCKYLITHSGNCGLWAVLYRGSSENVYQWLNNTWKRSDTEKFFVRLNIAYKKAFKRIVKGNKDYFLISESISPTEDSFSKNREAA